MITNYSEQIFRAREQSNLTQDQLASLVGVGSRSISAYESGRYYPQPGVVRLLNRVLKIVLLPAPPRRKRKDSVRRLAGPGAPKRKAAVPAPIPDLQEVASASVDIREVHGAQVGNYIRLLAHQEDGIQGDLTVYSIRIAASKPVTPRETLFALRQFLGDPRGYLDANEVETTYERSY